MPLSNAKDPCAGIYVQIYSNKIIFHHRTKLMLYFIGSMQIKPSLDIQYTDILNIQCNILINKGYTTASSNFNVHFKDDAGWIYRKIQERYIKRALRPVYRLKNWNEAQRRFERNNKKKTWSTRGGHIEQCPPTTSGELAKSSEIL